MNTVVLFVPQQEAWVVERMGKFHRILEPVSQPAASSKAKYMTSITNFYLLFFSPGIKLPYSDIGQNSLCAEPEGDCHRRARTVCRLTG